MFKISELRSRGGTATKPGQGQRGREGPVQGGMGGQLGEGDCLRYCLLT